MRAHSGFLLASSVVDVSCCIALALVIAGVEALLRSCVEASRGESRPVTWFGGLIAPLVLLPLVDSTVARLVLCVIVSVVGIAHARVQPISVCANLVHCLLAWKLVACTGFDDTDAFDALTAALAPAAPLMITSVRPEVTGQRRMDHP